MDEQPTFTVLIIEDSPEVCTYYREAFALYAETYELHFAADVEGGIALFHAHRDADAIVVDGELSPIGNWGKDFVARVRPEYAGPMIASSSSETMNEEMRALGCDYVARKKDRVPSMVRQVLTRPRKTVP